MQFRKPKDWKRIVLRVIAGYVWSNMTKLIKIYEVGPLHLKISIL